MHRIKKAWRKIPTPLRKSLIFLIGWVVVLAGIIMLITPGPGWVAIFLGFAILATEFAHAKRTQEWLVARLKIIVEWAKKLWLKIKKRLSK